MLEEIKNTSLTGLIFLAALLLGLFLIGWFSKRWTQRQIRDQRKDMMYLWGQPSPLLTLLRRLSIFLTPRSNGSVEKSLPTQKPQGVKRVLVFVLSDIPGFLMNWLVRLLNQPFWGAFAELLVLLVWCFILTGNLLNSAPAITPNGDDYGLQIQSHFFWELLPRCGTCVFWNGSINGGFPAFAEPQGAVLHPLTILTTLLWGGLAGGKILFLVSLFLAALGQWLLAKEMKLGLAARLWVGAAAAAGGHLSGRMDMGLVTVMLSLGTASLILAPAVALGKRTTWRSAVLLGFTLALTMLSGQGYIQIGVICAILPALLAYILFRPDAREFWKKLFTAGGLALLWSAVFWIPLLHFMPNMEKVNDSTLGAAQSFQYIPLNLLIRDNQFYNMTVLEHAGAPFVYILFIGWVPILLAVIALRLIPRSEWRTVLFFLGGAVLSMLIASKEVLWPLKESIPQLTYIRFPGLITGLAVPLILAVSAWGVDLIMRHLDIDLELGLKQDGKKLLRIPLSLVVFGVILLSSLSPLYQYSKPWYNSFLLDVPVGLFDAVRSDSAQWVTQPLGKFAWTVQFMDREIKTIQYVRPWNWSGRELPPARMEVSIEPEDTKLGSYQYSLGPYHILSNANVQYAEVQTGDGFSDPCHATALGGKIDLECDSSAGTLLVYENNWTGWSASVDGKPVKLLAGNWLSIKYPPGKHTVSFRYLPWDVLLGITLSLLGWGLAVWIWMKDRK